MTLVLNRLDRNLTGASEQKSPTGDDLTAKYHPFGDLQPSVNMSEHNALVEMRR